VVRIEGDAAWSDFVRHHLNLLPSDEQAKSEFHLQWTVGGHRMREQLNDDEALLNILWRWLPSYVGPALTLFRGENVDRWRFNEIGMCWTTTSDTAKMFGQGLNAVHSGGVLLKCDVSPTAIIAGPSSHSLYLNEAEYTVDPRLLGNVKIVEEYPTAS
jgi:hypothetical protein